MTPIASSPASSGPAGSQFEAQVGAHYLLSMLVGAEPRGLPGVSIDSVEFQRAAEGRPLDDVIINGHDVRGTPTLLEIQVKRSISFSPADPIFRSVVRQIAEASRRLDFWTSNSVLAIAIARSSRKIDGPYQDVLTWATQLESAETFFTRINRPGSANDDMRTFIGSFRTHLREESAPSDDETVWQLLRRLQILNFDFTAGGSVSEAIAKERAVNALQPSDTDRAGSLWSNLIEITLDAAASGGARTREQLIEVLTSRSFRLSGQRNYFPVRRVLEEAAKNALADIGDTVGEALLTRHERLFAIHTELDRGRYLELRGNAGVGKSGLLKHLANQLNRESQIIVLSPGRTTQRGWMAMRADLGFDGTAHDLLVDLASTGGGVLFLDGLDNFDALERTTVVDLVREAADIPGFSVVATARLDFGMNEPSWLPAEALQKLGQANTVTIEELSETEVEELRAAAPKLVWLLADDHPARDVSRNLFRLSRLADRTSGDVLPRTEVQLADDWWQTADGKYDSGHRERARVLKDLAEKTLLGTEPLDVSDAQAVAIDALVKSETLRDLTNDRVSFRHDVFGEWAIASLLADDLGYLKQLPLERPVSGLLARGVEITSRMLLEGAEDIAKWQSLFDEVSVRGAHGSWRRAALLALVRSEVSSQVLNTTAVVLLADGAKLLRELIRNVMAVDVQAASSLFKSEDIGGAKLPDSFNIPSSHSWPRLIVWLLSLGDELPAVAIPDVSDFYMEWSAGMFGRDPLTPPMLVWLHKWLMEIESRREAADFREWLQVFGGEINHDRLGKLESNLRVGFLLFCKFTPTLAVQYLCMLIDRGADDESARAVLKFSGSLAHAAPTELAEFTACALTPDADKEVTSRRRDLGGPFGFQDSLFSPASPSKGPFLELITHAPAVGLTLIRRLADQAIRHYSADLSPDEHAVKIMFPDGERTFPWIQSYTWSRWGRDYCLTSALMALEVWAHRRVESGDPLEEVLADVLGPQNAPAAYLLVAVDLLLSHWPKSREASIPFLACPELLCADRERQVHDNLPSLFGSDTPNQDPIGAVNRTNLEKRPSRQLMLDQLLGQLTFSGENSALRHLKALLNEVTDRLEPPSPQSNLGDPEFMLVHAKNVLDPDNWKDSPRQFPDGTTKIVSEYVPPEAETQHLQVLQDLSSDRLNNTNMENSINLALEDSSRSSNDLAAAVAAWAQQPYVSQLDEDPHAASLRERAIAGAAMIVMRDGDRELRDRHKAWARGVFVEALGVKEDPGHRIRPGLRFNQIAISFVGAAYLLKDGANQEDTKLLLDLASLEDPGGAQGLGFVRDLLNTIDDRLIEAVLRSAFASSLRPTRVWDLSDEQTLSRLQNYKERVQTAVGNEMNWLAGNGVEPKWPAFPSSVPRPRRRLRIPDAEESTRRHTVPRPQLESYVDHQSVALWLRHATLPVGDASPSWLLNLIQNYARWTAEANGSGMEAEEEVGHEPAEWNDIYYELLSYCLAGLGEEGIDGLVSAVITSLPDEPFLDVCTQFVKGLDVVYFGYKKIPLEDALRVRSTLADRLMITNEWRWLTNRRSSSVGIHIGSAVAALFMNEHGFTQPPKCYLTQEGIEHLDPFIPELERLIEAGPCLFVALVSLNLLEVSPNTSQFSFILLTAHSWLRSHHDDTEFWVDQMIGKRVCRLIEKTVAKDSELDSRNSIDHLLGELVRLGVAEASRLEASLSAER